MGMLEQAAGPANTLHCTDHWLAQPSQHANVSTSCLLLSWHECACPGCTRIPQSPHDTGPAHSQADLEQQSVLPRSSVVLQGHQYRNVCDLRRGAATSLITVDFASHTVQESYSNPRVPSGFPFSSVKAKLSELDFIFLNRFIQEILQYVSVMLALRAPPIQQHIQQSSRPALATASGMDIVQAEPGQSEGPVSAAPSGGKPTQAEQSGPRAAASASGPEGSKEVGAVVQLDIEMEAPVISMPRGSDSQDSVQLDLGFVNLHNSLRWTGGSSTDDPQVHGRRLSLYAPAAVMLGDLLHVQFRSAQDVLSTSDTLQHWPSVSCTAILRCSRTGSWTSTNGVMWLYRLS